MKRGVISLPCELKSRGNEFSLINVLGAVDLNFFALYWDELIIPASNVVYIEMPGEESFIKSGFLSRPIFNKQGDMSSFEMVKLYSDAQVSTLDKMRTIRKDTCWRLNHLGDELGISGGDVMRKETVLLELYGALPVPDKTINIQDILNFKEKRKDELEALHHYLEGMYSEIMMSGDFYLTRAKSFSRLNDAIKDINKLNSEGWRSPIRFDTSALFECDIRTLISGSCAAKSIYEASSGNIAEAILNGSVALLVEGVARLKPKFQSIRTKPNNNISYLSKARKDGFCK